MALYSRPACRRAAALPRTHQQHISGPNPYPGGLLGGFEVLGKDMLIGVKHVDAAQAGDVKEYPTGRDSLAESEHVVRQSPLAIRDHRGRHAAVELAVPEDVRQRVEVGDVEAVEHHPDVLLGAACPPATDQTPAALLAQPEPGRQHVPLVLDGGAWLRPGADVPAAGYG